MPKDFPMASQLQHKCPHPCPQLNSTRWLLVYMYMCRDVALKTDLHNVTGYPSSFIRKLTKTRPTEPTQKFKSTAVLPYVKGVSEVFHRCLKQQGICTSNRTQLLCLTSLVQPKDTPEPTKQDGVVYSM